METFNVNRVWQIQEELSGLADLFKRGEITRPELNARVKLLDKELTAQAKALAKEKAAARGA